ncbi:hypothetical protein ABMA59_29310 [Mesorhizobium sp. CN2-181]
MDWTAAIDKNREALKRILAMLVAMAGLAAGAKLDADTGYDAGQPGAGEPGAGEPGAGGQFFCFRGRALPLQGGRGRKKINCPRH